jgi:hypothetical protein
VHSRLLPRTRPPPLPRATQVHPCVCPKAALGRNPGPWQLTPSTMPSRLPALRPHPPLARPRRSPASHQALPLLPWAWAPACLDADCEVPHNLPTRICAVHNLSDSLVGRDASHVLATFDQRRYMCADASLLILSLRFNLHRKYERCDIPAIGRQLSDPEQGACALPDPAKGIDQNA